MIWNTLRETAVFIVFLFCILIVFPAACYCTLQLIFKRQEAKKMKSSQFTAVCKDIAKGHFDPADLETVLDSATGTYERNQLIEALSLGYARVYRDCKRLRSRESIHTICTAKWKGGA